MTRSSTTFGKQLFNAAVGFLDLVLGKEWDWKFIRKGPHDDQLFTRTLVSNGITYVAVLSVDRKTKLLHGSIGTEDRPGALACGDGRFYYPEVTESRLISGLVCQGKSAREACREASRILQNRMYQAMTYGTDWFMYEMKIEAHLNEWPLTELSISGINAKFGGLKMDPRIDAAFDTLVESARELADLELDRLKVRNHVDYTYIPMHGSN